MEIRGVRRRALDGQSNEKQVFYSIAFPTPSLSLTQRVPLLCTGFPESSRCSGVDRADVGKGALEKVLKAFTGLYRRVFLISKGTRVWRPIIDILSVLNLFIDVTKFKMKPVSLVLSTIRPGDFLAALNLEDAFFQVSLHPASYPPL